MRTKLTMYNYGKFLNWRGRILVCQWQLIQVSILNSITLSLNPPLGVIYHSITRPYAYIEPSHKFRLELLYITVAKWKVQLHIHIYIIYYTETRSNPHYLSSSSTLTACPTGIGKGNPLALKFSFDREVDITTTTEYLLTFMLVIS